MVFLLNNGIRRKQSTAHAIKADSGLPCQLSLCRATTSNDSTVKDRKPLLCVPTGISARLGHSKQVST